MDDPQYLTMYDESGNEIWVNPEISDSQFNQLFNQQKENYKIEVVEKPTNLIWKIAIAILILIWWFKFKKK